MKSHPTYLTNPVEYGIWSGMRSRCRNPHAKDWRLYGGRGIRVCPRWESFQDFVADMGLRPSKGHSIDRIDCNGNYEPGNCRWATTKEQSANKRPYKRGGRIVSHEGLRLNITEWAARFGISPSALSHRIRKHGELGAFAAGPKKPLKQVAA